MDNLAVVDGGDEPVGNSSDGLVEIGLGGEDIECGLWRQWGISRDDCGGDRVKWDWEDGHLGRCSGWGLIGRVDRVVGHRCLGHMREGSGDLEVNVGIGMELQF